MPISKITFHNGKSIPDPSNIHRLVHCKVLPPKHLEKPVFPYKAHKRLAFSLCHSCMDESNTENCTHGKEKRAIKEVICTPDLEMALEKGYVILKHTKTEMEMTAGTGLFKPYVDSFPKTETRNQWGS